MLAVEEFPSSQSLTPLYVFGSNGGAVTNHQFSGNSFNFNLTFSDPIFLLSGRSYLFCELVTVFGSPSSVPLGLGGSPFIQSNLSSQLPNGASSIQGESTQFRASYSAASKAYVFTLLTHFNPSQDIRVSTPAFFTSVDREAVFPSAVTGTVFVYLIDVTGNDDGAAAIVAAIQSQTTTLSGNLSIQTSSIQSTIQSAISSQTTTLNNQLVTQGNSTRTQISNAAKSVSDMLVTQGNATRQTMQTEGKAIRDKIDEVFNQDSNPDITSSVNAGASEVTSAVSSIDVATHVSDSLWQGLQSSGQQSVLRFPGVKVPIQGTDYQVIQPYDVDLGTLDTNFPALMTAVRAINTFLCCAATLAYAHHMIYKFLGAPPPTADSEEQATRYQRNSIGFHP